MVSGYLNMLAAVWLGLLPVSASAGPEVSAWITLDKLVLPAGAPAPYLGDQGWIVDEKLATDPKRELLKWARRKRITSKTCVEECFMYVSLGPSPTFGAFLRTAQSLRQLGLCRSVFVREGGVLKSPGVVAAVDNDMVGLDVC